MSMPKVGDRINNYLLEALIGQGSFGQVWRARHHMFDQSVAIKVPTDAQYVRNLQREGVAIHGVQHDNIVRALDMDPYAETPYLIMELVEGPSLREVIDGHPQGMPIGAAVSVMQGLLAALDVAHRAGLIHRDVKPANILLQSPADRIAELTPVAVKVADFGLGRVCGATTASIMQSGSVHTEGGKSISGTVAYMSPEQKAGQDVDARSDLYSCGIVLFEMLVGERPSGVELPSALRPEVSKTLDDVFQRSYTRLDRRFHSAIEMLNALHAPSTRRGLPPIPQGGLARGACSSCGGATRSGDHFCIHCGTQLVAHVPRCPSCSAFVSGGDLYCIFCGHQLPARAG